MFHKFEIGASENAIIILNIWIDSLKELHYLPVRLHLLDTLLYVKPQFKI